LDWLAVSGLGLVNPLDRVSSYGHTSNVQRYTGVTYRFYFLTFGHSGARAERQSARMSEIKNGRLGL